MTTNVYLLWYDNAFNGDTAQLKAVYLDLDAAEKHRLSMGPDCWIDVWPVERQDQKFTDEQLKAFKLKMEQIAFSSSCHMSSLVMSVCGQQNLEFKARQHRAVQPGLAHVGQFLSGTFWYLMAFLQDWNHRQRNGRVDV